MTTTMLDETPDVAADALYRIVRHGRLFTVRWLSNDALGQLMRVLPELTRAVQSEPEIVYLGFMGDESSVPGPDAQLTLARATREILKLVSEFHLVIEGRSFQTIANRTLFRGMLAAVRVTGHVLNLEFGGLTNKVTIHDSIDAFLRIAAPRLGVPRAELLQTLVQSSIVQRG